MKKVYDHEKTDEFITMSLKPGIGTGFFEKHWRVIYDTDKVYINNGGKLISSPPRYFDKLMERFHPELLDKVKTERISNVNISVIDELIKFGMQYREEAFEVYTQSAINKMKEKLTKRK